LRRRITDNSGGPEGEQALVSRPLHSLFDGLGTPACRVESGEKIEILQIEKLGDCSGQRLSAFLKVCQPLVRGVFVMALILTEIVRARNPRNLLFQKRDVFPHLTALVFTGVSTRFMQIRSNFLG
jgi:hypothetical protein